MSNPIVHIGYPKTATKWFQHNFYPALKDIAFIQRQDVFRILIKPDIFEFDPVVAFQQIQLITENKRLIICEELLLGGLDISFGTGEFIQLMAHRIKSTLPDAEIVIFIRNQETMVASAYNQYIRSGGTYSQARYLGYSKRFKAFFKNHHLFNLKFFEYDLIIDLYKKIFGFDKVHVFLYEDFLHNPIQFLNEYCNKFSLPHSKFPVSTIENRSFSSLAIKFMRFMNHFTYKNTAFKNYLFHIDTIYYRTLSVCDKIDRISFFRNRPYKLKSGLINEINTFYKPSNLRLSSHVEIEKLRKYFYPM